MDWPEEAIGPHSVHACDFCMGLIDLYKGPRINLIIIFDDTLLSNDIVVFLLDFICGLHLEHFCVRQDGLNIKFKPLCAVTCTLKNLPSWAEAADISVYLQLPDAIHIFKLT